MKTRELNVPRSEIEHVIDEWVFSQRDRLILKRRMLDGIGFERLAEEFDMSVQGIKLIVYKNLTQILDHI